MTGAVWGGVAAVAVASLAYLVYFDQKRQSDPAFRKKLRADRKKAEKKLEERKREAATAAAASRRTSASPAGGPAGRALNDEYIKQLEEEPFPKSQAEKEVYFMKHLDVGTELLSKGPKYYDAAAKCFIRVLKIYHDPMQLLMIIESTVPPAVFSLIMDLMAKDVGMAGAGGAAAASAPSQPTVEEIE